MFCYGTEGAELSADCYKDGETETASRRVVPSPGVSGQEVDDTQQQKSPCRTEGRNGDDPSDPSGRSEAEKMALKASNPLGPRLFVS